jgi:hypothetical protein
VIFSLYSGSSIIFWRILLLIFALSVAVNTRALPHALEQNLPCLLNVTEHVGQILGGYIRWRLVGMAIVERQGYQDRYLFMASAMIPITIRLLLSFHPHESSYHHH